jgi:hypothetical protein
MLPAQIPGPPQAPGAFPRLGPGRVPRGTSESPAGRLPGRGPAFRGLRQFAEIGTR